MGRPAHAARVEHLSIFPVLGTGGAPSHQALALTAASSFVVPIAELKTLMLGTQPVPPVSGVRTGEAVRVTVSAAWTGDAPKEGESSGDGIGVCAKTPENQLAQSKPRRLKDPIDMDYIPYR